MESPATGPHQQTHALKTCRVINTAAKPPPQIVHRYGAGGAATDSAALPPSGQVHIQPLRLLGLALTSVLKPDDEPPPSDPSLEVDALSMSSASDTVVGEGSDLSELGVAFTRGGLLCKIQALPLMASLWPVLTCTGGYTHKHTALSNQTTKE